MRHVYLNYLTLAITIGFLQAMYSVSESGGIVTLTAQVLEGMFGEVTTAYVGLTTLMISESAQGNHL